MNAPDLAIVVPAYKARHLRRTLECLRAQTDQSFHLYVFDDCSPEPVSELAREAGFPPERFTLLRFEQNLGGRSLIQHWDRCLRQTTEPWLWLFSDDDEMDPTCVAAWRQARAASPLARFFRFNTVQIDDAGVVTELRPQHGEWETGWEYLHHSLRFLRPVSMQECLFHREAYFALPALPDFPLAWYSDTAFILSCSLGHGIRTIAGPRVRFRLSGHNISTAGSRAVFHRKLEALLAFQHWVRRELERPDGPADVFKAWIPPLMRGQFFRALVRNRVRLPGRILAGAADFIQRYHGAQAQRDLWRLRLLGWRSLLWR